MTVEQEQMVLRNQGLIGLALKKLKLKYNREEFASIGMIGLCKGVLSFDKEKGYKESPYLYKSIWNEMTMYIRNQNTASRGRDIQIMSLDYAYDLGTGEDIRLSDVLEDTNENVEEKIESAEVLNALKEEISKLKEKDRFVINHLFGIDCEKITQKEIAKILNTSQTNIYRRKIRALRELRKELNDYV